jgi:hypothetical protein
MAWWDINLHTNDTVSNIWDKFQGGLKQSIANLFTPGMFARAIANDPTGQVDQSPTDSETPVVEPEPSVDAEGSIGSTGSANVLLRRRKLQNALKYGFASTIKHYQGNTTKPVEYAEPKLLVGA